METATLTSPPRPVMVQPVQKSLSLPSYARAGGEGIDHKLIFAALEQREKVRRKSKIFKEKEKCGATRQNIFCLPLSSSNKCRETSLSSDTSCSSLEFQKPKRSSSPAKISKEQNGIDGTEITPLNEKTDVNGNLDEMNCFAPAGSPIEKELSTKEQTNRNEVSRSAVGSSDSMERTERSSKSSNDSLSRKERLVAIKARVEAERERTLCDSSSDEEETILRITRHNSDGVIHRTVREVKSKATRAERRFRRKATEDSAARRVARKQHRSLYLPQSTDLDAWKPPIVRSGSSFSLQRDLDEINKDFFNLENKPKYLLSQSVPKDNYFSDICSGSYRSRFVKPVVDEIEAKERRQLLNNDRIVASFRSNKTVVSTDGTKSIDVSPHSSFMRDIVKKRNSRLDNSFEVSRKCNSPISRAPTPPPRSPKSMEFVNKVLLQHQTASPSNFYNEACSLERKRTVFRPKISVPTTAAELNSLDAIDRIDRDLISARRKTCSNFSQMEDISNERPKTPSYQHQTKLSQHIPPRSPDLSQKLTGVTRRAKLSDIPTTKLSISTGKRWEKIEVDSEKKFNSLESRSKSSDTNWTKWKVLPRKKRNNCICLCSPNSVQDCNCHRLSQQGCKIDSIKISLPVDAESSPKLPYASNKFSHSPLDRLHKLENGVTRSYSRKLSTPEVFITSITRTESHETKEDSEFCFTTRNDAAETLNTAMQELESVYQSLRFSNENLSEKSNKTTERTDDEFSVCSRICNGSVDDYSKSKEIIKNNYPKENTHFRPVSPNRKGGLSVNEALCIEELFGDLTQQLDLEQKLLQETKSKKTPGSPVQKRNSDQVTRSDSSRLSPQTVSNDSTNNKREFTKKEKGETDSLETAAISNIKQRVMAKRKLKAVRSLSENLASIIQNETARKEKVENNLPPDKNRNSPSLEIINKMADDVSLVASKTSACKKDSPHYKSQNLAAEVTKHSDCDEIWQVRVSMDSGNPPEDPPLQPQNPSQLRLHSALRTPSENIVRRDELQANECLKTNSSASRDKTDVLLSENELEKLLAMLLRDVSNNPIPEKKHPSLPPKETHDNESATVVSKGTSGYVNNKCFVQNMEPGISSQSRTKNEERLVELLPEASGVPENGKLDNDSNQNNNDSSDVHCSPFMQLPGQHPTHGYRVSDDNRSLASLRNSSCVENICNPHAAWLTSRGSVRRHSVGLDDFSGLSIYSGHRNSNQEQRPPIFDHSAVSHCSSDTTANCSRIVDTSKAQSQIEYIKEENQNNPRNIEFTVRSPCNGSPRRHSPVNFNSVQNYEKLKDKSFMRKSSLNRLEFVDHACHHATAYASSENQSYHPTRQQSSSEANSDQERNRSLTVVASTSTKRKNNSGRRTEKELCGGLSRQDALPEKSEHGNNLTSILNSRYREGSLRCRTRKSPRSSSHFKKKSYSAGEQESYSDFGENTSKVKVCFSAQELKHNCTYKEFSQLPLGKKSTNSDYSQGIGNMQVELMGLNEELKNKACVSFTCDTSSHICENAKLPKSSGVEDSHLLHGHKPDVQQDGDSCTRENVTCAEHLEIDQDLFCSHDFVPSLSLRCFPTGNSLTSDHTSHENNEISAPSPHHTACNAQSVTDVAEELLSLEKPSECTESQNVKNSTPVESDAESSRQPSSILRKKHSEEKREIHGILKNTEEKVSSRQLPSILKHRESSEEKDTWSQSDLHSILKKSTSEDESSNSPDIRPILKNTSTDDESSGFSSKPKPILKKRTSFSEECSYACFHSGELKPILKKKSVVDMCEEQPKPILKTRRKSEEATAIASEFAVGTRPRAYSADRGVKKTVIDDDRQRCEENSH